jgi:hypothetical protein
MSACFLYLDCSYECIYGSLLFMQTIWELNWFLHINCYLLIMINVKLTPSGLSAYLSVWMGRRCAGLVGFRWVAWCFAWIAGANLRCQLLSLRFRLWLGVSCLWIYVSYMLRSFIHCRISEITFMTCVVLWHVILVIYELYSAATAENFICMSVGFCWDVASISWIFAIFACFIALIEIRRYSVRHQEQCTD